MTELRLFVDPVVALSFVEMTVAPADRPDSYAWVVDVGDLVLQARTGQYRGGFSDQSASVDVTLDNAGRQAASLVGQPLRKRGEIMVDGSLYFSGLVQAVAYGPQLVLSLEA